MLGSIRHLLLAPLLSSQGTTKIIHYAPFERKIFARHGLEIEPVIDTREVSLRLRGDAVNGGHSLRAVCARELQVELDKSEQAGDWKHRPLTESQVTYAALDAEVLLRLNDHFQAPSFSEKREAH